MSADNALTVYDREKVELLKTTICKGATDGELHLFIAQCQRTGLDPFVRQIYMLKRKEYDPESGQYLERMVMQIGIDGYRRISDRTGKYVGTLGPYWCGPEGKWTDVWLKPEPPAAAKVGIVREGFKEPVWGVCRYSEYVQLKRDGKPTAMWAKMPSNQLAKCAEGQAHRKAFPQEFSGLEPAEELQPAPEADTIEGTASVITTTGPGPDAAEATGATPEAGPEQPVEPERQEPPAPPARDRGVGDLPKPWSPTLAPHASAGVNSPKLLCDALRLETDYYNDAKAETIIYHTLNAIRKQIGEPAWNWPDSRDLAGWSAAFAAALTYARGQQYLAAHAKAD